MEKDTDTTGDCTNSRAETRLSSHADSMQCLQTQFVRLHGNGISPVTTGHYCFVLQRCNCGVKSVCVMGEECMLKPMTFGQEVTEHPHDSMHVCAFKGCLLVCIRRLF